MEEKAKKTATSRAKSTKVSDESIREGYIDYVLSHDKAPSSVFLFAKSLKMREEDFYNHFTSLESLEKSIISGFFTETVSILEKDEVYKDYSAREKVLSLYYTWVEVLRKNRSFVLFTLKHHQGFETPHLLKDTRTKFKEFVKTILAEGTQTEEVINRPYISDKYDEALWFQALFIIHFWLKDESKGFEKTDAAIEKAVNLSFELMAKSPLDSMIDFAKFLYQSRK